MNERKREQARDFYKDRETGDWDNTGNDWAKYWQQVRSSVKAVPVPPSQEVTPGKLAYDPKNHDFDLNCAEYAFRVAGHPLEARRNQFGMTNPGFLGWVTAQDTVFHNCDSGPSIPPEASADLPQQLRSDRNYQIAAAHPLWARYVYSVLMSITRRTFGASVAGMAGAMALQGQTPDRKIGYCIIGLGRISMNEFMPGVKLTGNCRITGIVSGHRDKAERVASQYGVPAGSIYSYEDMGKIADNKDIDAVYVALPNSMHAEYTIRSAQAGKHVLCEKPMATSVAECEKMIAACKSANRKLMIAYRCQYEPNYLKAQQTIRGGRIGTFELYDSSFGFTIAPGEWRLSKKLAGGGPLMDVGIYCLNACRFLSGEEPVEVDARWDVIDKDGRFTEVEENLVWSMRFPSGLLATCNTSYGTNTGGWYRAYGSKGSVQMEPAFSYQGLAMKITGPAHSDGGDTVADSDPHQFTREAEHMAECIVQNKQPRSAGEEGLRDMRILEAIYRSCKQAGPVKLA